MATRSEVHKVKVLLCSPSSPLSIQQGKLTINMVGMDIDPWTEIWLRWGDREEGYKGLANMICSSMLCEQVSVDHEMWVRFLSQLSFEDFMQKAYALNPSYPRKDIAKLKEDNYVKTASAIIKEALDAFSKRLQEDSESA